MIETLRRLLICLVLLLAGLSVANACDPVVPLAWQPKLHNSPYDANDNQVDDALEALDPATLVDPILALTDCPEPEDIARLGTFGTVTFNSEFFPIIFMTGVRVSRLVMLAKDPIVAFVEEDSPVYHTLSTSNPAVKVKASLDYSPDTVHDKFPTVLGTDINIAVVDFGIDDQAGPGTTHESLPAGRFRGGMTCPLFGACADVNPDDTSGTGTAVAGVAVGQGEGGVNAPHEGLAPGAGFFDVRIQTFPALRAFLLIKTIDAILSKARSGFWVVHVIELPFSNCRDSNGTDTLSAAVNAAASRGIAVVTGMGNCSTCTTACGGTCPCRLVPSPAAAENAIVVGYSDDLSTVNRADDALSVDSLRGPRLDDGDADSTDEMKPDVVAPGANIAVPQFNTAGVYVDSSGSSLAAAHVAGCAALMLQVDPAMGPLLLRERFRETAEDRGPVSWDPEWGYGLLDCFEAVDLVHSFFCAEIVFPGACGDRPLPPCSVHPSLRASDPEIREGVPNSIIVDIRNLGPGLVNRPGFPGDPIS